MSNQLPLPSIFDPSLPVEVSGSELAATIKDIERAGFTVRRLDVTGASGYRLHLQRKPSTIAAPEQLDEDLLVALAIVLDFEERSFR